MPSTILGLDIGGANVKAATAAKQAITVPFALWKQPDRLPEVLAGLVARFDGIEGLAITMTGELCDCFETRREGVNRILDAVETVARGRPVGVWSTEGKFVTAAASRRDPMAVASANWHALATFAGRYALRGRTMLIDVGSTTTDLIPIQDGIPVPSGRTDRDRLRTGELVYAGVRRTPVCAVVDGVMAEFFATVHDAYLVLGQIAEDADDFDTADGRPATKACAHARLSRMLGGDAETMSIREIISLAEQVFSAQTDMIIDAIERVSDLAPSGYISSGSGDWLASSLRSWPQYEDARWQSLSEATGPEVSAAAPAYALAVLAAERGLP